MHIDRYRSASEVRILRLQDSLIIIYDLSDESEAQNVLYRVHIARYMSVNEVESLRLQEFLKKRIIIHELWMKLRLKMYFIECI